MTWIGISSSVAMGVGDQAAVESGSVGTGERTDVAVDVGNLVPVSFFLVVAPFVAADILGALEVSEAHELWLPTTSIW